MKQRILCMLLSIAIVFTSVDLSVFATEVEDVIDTISGIDAREEYVVEENQNTPSKENVIILKNSIQNSENAVTRKTDLAGKCGDNLNWKIDGTTLIISGEGAMYDYEEDEENNSTAPWIPYKSSLTTLKLDHGITYIGNEAFLGCWEFKGILSLPDTVTTIGESAFQSCNGFTSISFSNNLKEIGKYAFLGCSSVNESLNFPEGLESIGYHAFDSCFNITGDLIIPSTVTYIGDFAFYYCKGLGENLYIKSSSLAIGEKAFWTNTISTVYGLVGTAAEEYATNEGWNFIVYGDEQDGVEEIVSGKCGDNLTWILEKGTLTISGVGEMWNYNSREEQPWYEHRESLSRLVIEEGVTSIGKRAFSGCTRLSGELVIPNSVTNIEIYAFYECYGFKGDLVIPSEITEIKAYSFYLGGFDGTLVIPNGVSEIEYYAFMGCNFSGELVIPNSVTSIGNDAFYACSGFSGDLVIPDNVTYIGGDAFTGCTGFKGELIIGNKVKMISKLAFNDCRGINRITFKGTVPETIQSNIFRGITADVYYPVNDSAWEKIVGNDFGGTLNWITLQETESVELELSFGGRKKFSFSPHLFENSSIGYKEDVSELSICLSTMVYETNDVDEYEEHKRMAKNFQKLGFSVEKNLNDFINGHYYEDETGHSTEQEIQGNYAPFWIVNQEIILDGKTYDLIFVVVRGTYDMEWIDNFDSGIGDTHMGFERAAIRISERLSEYVKVNNITGNIKVLVTGHSRGAAVANLVGKKLDDKEIIGLKNIDKSDIYVYTYATPNVTRKENIDNSTYDNIYNIVNPEDFVTKVLPTAWGYYRYGITYSLPSSSIYPNGISIEEGENEYFVTYNNFIERVSDKVGYYRPEATKYEKYKPFDDGMLSVVKYVDSITSVIPNIKSYYSLKLSKDTFNGIFSKAGIGAATSLFSLFKTALGYFMTEYYKGQGLLALLNAGTLWGNVGTKTLHFFVHKEGLTEWFGCAHTAETYMAMLDIIPQWVLEKEKVFNGYIVNCPVDIVVKDKDGNILGKIEQNNVYTTTEELAMSVEGDSKSFLMHEDADYTIELIGNGSGTMDYSIVRYDADKGEIGRTVYLNLPLEKNTAYTQKLSANDSAEEIPLLDSEANIVEKTMTLDEEEIGSLAIKVNIIGNGFAQGYESLTFGDYVILSAITNEYNEFLGWYDKDGNLICTNKEYGVSIEKNEEFTAKFTDNDEIKVESNPSSKPNSDDIGESKISSDENSRILIQQEMKQKDTVDMDFCLSHMKNHTNKYFDMENYNNKKLEFESLLEGQEIEDAIALPELENEQTIINESEAETKEQKCADEDYSWIVLLASTCMAIFLGIVVFKNKNKKS